MLPGTLRRQRRQGILEIEATIVPRIPLRERTPDGNQQNKFRELLTKTRNHVVVDTT